MKSNIVPKASPAPLPELDTFLAPFASLFRRHTSRDSMERYVTGLLTDLPHKTADTIAATVAGTSTERLQHLLTDATWDVTALDEARVKHLLSIHPPTAGVLVFDDTGLPKKGTESVGVAAQYSGTLGKIGNCQVVVSAQYLADDPASSTPFHFPVSARLYLPESWITDDERRKQTHVPAQISQQTKPEIALSLLDQAHEWGMPIQAVVVDAGYGDNPNFLAGLDARRVPYVCAVESTFGVRLPQEVLAASKEVPAYGADSHASPVRPRSTASRNSSKRCPSPLGKPSGGAKEPKAPCRHRRSPSACIGQPAHHATAPAIAASTLAPKAGCWPSAPRPYSRVTSRPPTSRCQPLIPSSRKSQKSKKPRRPSTGSARCRLRPRSHTSSPWPTHAG